MSIQTWLDDFYPVDASDPSVQESELKAARHSLRKWRGLFPFNLEKHKVNIDIFFCILHDEKDDLEFNPISSASCALCHYNKFYPDNSRDACDTCIVTRFDLGCIEIDSAYRTFTLTRNPDPMVEVLDKCVQYLESEVE